MLYGLEAAVSFVNIFVDYSFKTLLFSLFLLFIWHNEKQDLGTLLPKRLNVD
jgi:hypothetical protein